MAHRIGSDGHVDRGASVRKHVANVRFGSKSEVRTRNRKVRSGLNNGHDRSGRSGPFRAKLGNGSRRKIALHCEPTRSEAVMSRHIVLVPMS